MKYPEYSEEELRRFGMAAASPADRPQAFKNLVRVPGGVVVMEITATFVPDPPVTPQPAPPPWLSQEDPEDMDWRDDAEPTGD